MSAARELNVLRLTCGLLSLLVGCSGASPSGHTISLATHDGGAVVADVYGNGARGVVLAPGAAFDRTSWRPFAEYLAAHGYRVLAIDFRDRGRADVAAEDVLAAIRHLRRTGAARVGVVGASLGGVAAARAAVAAESNEIDRLVLLSPAPFPEPERLNAPVLFVATEQEANVDRVRDLFRRAMEPKRLLVLPGSAHAQHVFETQQAERLRAAVLDFLDGV